MGELIFITGGARSGKSTFTEKLALESSPYVTYIATAINSDEEMNARIKKHRESRPSEWQTIEMYKNFDQLPDYIREDTKFIMLDCITVMVTNLMMDMDADWDNPTAEDYEKTEKYIQNEVEKLVHALKSMDITAALVSNEVGMGIVPVYPMARFFRDAAGRVNQYLARNADRAWVIISGMPMKLK